MRRTTVLLTSLATLFAFGPMGVAHADSTVTVNGTDWPAPSEDGQWDGVGWVVPLLGGCDHFINTPQYETIRYTVDYSDDIPAAGERVQGFDLQNATNTAIGPAAFTDTPSTSTFDMRVKVPGGPASGRLVALYQPPGSANLWMGWTTVTHPGDGWATISGAGARFKWQQKQDYGSVEPWGPPQGPATLADFVATHGGDGVEQYEGYALLGAAFGCDTERFHFDVLRVGPPGDVTTYDFEGQEAPALRIRSSAGTVTAGRPVTLGGSSPMRWSAGVTMTLEERPHGAPEFTTVGTATAPYDETTGEQGWAELVRSPQVRTEYRWVIPESSSMEQHISPIEVVEVRAAVTAALADRTLRKGEKLVVTGKTTPRKSRTPATLQRNVSGTWRTLATGQTARDGSYVFRKQVGTAGKWKVRVQVAASGGNLKGTSPARTATVR